MGKLVFGIAVIFLLQVSFFVFTALYDPGETESSIASNQPLQPISRPELPASGDVQAEAAAIPAPDVSAPLPRSEKRIASGISRASNRLNEGRKDLSEPKPALEDSGKAIAQDIVIRKGPSSPMIPSGHTMVLVDHLSNTSTRIRSAPVYRSKAKSNEVVKPDRPEGTAEVAKVKKRSYLERTLPLVVKKPWGWMKSLASKLK